MASWPTLQAAIDDLRRFVNDGPRDRPVKRKQVIGRVDGINVHYMTWDDRIIANTLQVSLNDVAYDPSQVVVDDSLMGMFHLVESPGPPVVPAPAQQTVRAAYYFQYFLDSELSEAIMMSTEIITSSDDPTTVAPGLKPAAIHFGASFAYGKQAMRWAQRKSAEFILEEEPLSDDAMNRPNLFAKLQANYYKQGISLRDSYYMRDGRRNAPAFNVFKPNTTPSPPFPVR